jgi:hypothetical protein
MFAKLLSGAIYLALVNARIVAATIKDRQPVYNAADLIKPDEEDPEYFFLFVSDGTVAIRENLDLSEKCRAETTLRIFNLNSGRLRVMRWRELQSYAQELDEYQQMAGDSELLPLVQAEIDKRIQETASAPFATAIKHVLEVFVA